MVLNHDVITGRRLLGLVHPSLDHIKAAFQQMQGRHEGRAGDTGYLVHNRLFHVALNSLQHGAISDLAEGSHSRTTVIIFFPGHVFCQAAGHNDDILCDARHLLDSQVAHAAQRGIIGLKELGHRKESLGGFCGPQVLPLIYEIKDLGEDVGTFSRVDRCFIKDPSLLEYSTLLQVLEGVGASTYSEQRRLITGCDPELFSFLFLNFETESHAGLELGT